MQSIENKVISRIYGRGRGWAFSQKDFASIAGRSAIDLALHRLEKKGTIRRVIRGIYDYPRYSKKLGQQLSPDIDQVARAIARKWRWDIQPSGPAALSILGLSTQIPAKYLYQSNGPDRSYKVGKTQIAFQKVPPKETGFKHHESYIIVQALKSLGAQHITRGTISKIRNWLDPKLRDQVMKDTRTVAEWIYDAIRDICKEPRSNG